MKTRKLELRDRNLVGAVSAGGTEAPGHGFRSERAGGCPGRVCGFSARARRRTGSILYLNGNAAGDIAPPAADFADCSY